jgi:hypothetical protein
MRRVICAIALLALVTPAFASDKFAGTWQMNTQKSTGPEAATAEQLVAVDDGADQTITVTGKAPDGSPITTKFSVPLKGGTGKIIDAAPFTAVTSKPYTATTSDFMFMTGDKPAMHIHSVLSSDGKMMTTTRKVMNGPTKPGTYTDIWERQ